MTPLVLDTIPKLRHEGHERNVIAGEWDMALLDASIGGLACGSLAGGPPIARPADAMQEAGFFESGGGMMAFIALIGFVTCLNGGAPRPPAPGFTVSPLSPQAATAPRLAPQAAVVPRLASPAPVAEEPPVAAALVAPEAAPENPEAEAEFAASETPTPLLDALAAAQEVAEEPARAKPELEVAASEAPRPLAEATAPAMPAVMVDDIATSSISPKPGLPAADLLPPSFEFSIGGAIRVSGVVADKVTGAALLADLKAVHGAGSVTGAVAVDARRASAAWLSKMPAALKSLKSPGLTVLFSGDDIVLRGRISDAERARLSSVLAQLFGGGVKVVALADHLNGVSARANGEVAKSLAALQPGFSAADLVGALNLSILNFTSSSADLPENERALLSEAAALFKQLPKGTLIEISGHTDSTGAEEENVPLSRRRAEAVRALLVKAGVNPTMLVATGHGGSVPIAGNESVEGRFRNRRIEYRLASAKPEGAPILP
jgi:OOP family OmpA-OmpF porin